MRFLAALRGLLGVEDPKTQNSRGHDLLDRVVSDLSVERSEHSKLREAVRMMGLDPAKLSAYGASNRSFHAPKLLQCVSLDEVKLLKYLGEAPELSKAYRTVWAGLKLQQDSK